MLTLRGTLWFASTPTPHLRHHPVLPPWPIDPGWDTDTRKRNGTDGASDTDSDTESETSWAQSRYKSGKQTVFTTFPDSGGSRIYRFRFRFGFWSPRFPFRVPLRIPGPSFSIRFGCRVVSEPAQLARAILVAGYSRFA